jgi:HK97 gp10 family phage protein
MLFTEGLEEVVAGFVAEAALAEPRASDAVQEAAEAIAADARSLAPKLTGRLAGSIEVDGSGTSAEVGPTVDYAPFVEFGTAYMAPQPFMGPATDRHEGDIEKALMKSIGEL